MHITKTEAFNFNKATLSAYFPAKQTTHYDRPVQHFHPDQKFCEHVLSLDISGNMTVLRLSLYGKNINFLHSKYQRLKITLLLLIH